MADQGADANLMSVLLFKEIQEEMPDRRPIGLHPAQNYRSVAGKPCLSCNQKVKIDIFLRIRHGSHLTVRNVVWKVSKESFETPIKGRSVLESLACDNLEMLMAAREKYGREIDVKEWLSDAGNDDKSSRKIAALFGESVFHIGEMVEDDGFQDDDIYVDFGSNPQESRDEKLDKRVTEAAQNGLSNAGVERLK